METNRLIYLLAKRMGKEASEEEEEELRQLLNNKPEFTFFSGLLDAVESDRKVNQPVKSEDLVADNWTMLTGNLEVKKAASPAGMVYPWEANRRQRRWRGFWRWAAIWVGILLLAGGGFWLLNNNRQKHTTFITGAGQISQSAHGAPEKLLLPDGSVVWLNAGSNIQYAENFVEDKREIYLQGEAYFDVRHDAAHPFIVHAGRVEIKVLGTAFNVQAYKNEGKVETTLIDGKIKVQMEGNPDKSFVLKPNEKLTIAMDAGKEAKTMKKLQPERLKEVRFKVEELEPPAVATSLPEIAWLEDKLVFKNERFDELAKSLERRYDVTIIFKNASLKKERLHGIFKNENIQKALKILQMIIPFQYEIEGDTVYLDR